MFETFFNSLEEEGSGGTAVKRIYMKLVHQSSRSVSEFLERHCVINPSQTYWIILIRFISLNNNWMNPCLKTEGKCNESVNNEFKIMRERDSLHQIMRVSK